MKGELSFHLVNLQKYYIQDKKQMQSDYRLNAKLLVSDSQTVLYCGYER